MNYLSLFSGVEGGGLAFHQLIEPKWRCLGYVEFDEYCQAVLAQRINDGYLDPAPIFGDIHKFIEAGYAGSYSGMVDLITAGFPCQPFSIYNPLSRKGEQDERNMWPSTCECIRIIRPKYAFLENVSNLLTDKYIRTIYGDLAEAGYNVRWCVLGADDCGAPHQRKRWWCLAYPISTRQQGRLSSRTKKRFSTYGIRDQDKVWNKNREENALRPMLDGIPYSMAHRMDRIKATGNGQVSIVAALAWKILTGDI